jgi:hypothetical protein
LFCSRHSDICWFIWRWSMRSSASCMRLSASLNSGDWIFCTSCDISFSFAISSSLNAWRSAAFSIVSCSSVAA